MTAQAQPDIPHSRRALHGALDDLSGVGAVVEAGARARAVAERCEASGVAAVLLDGAGRVLHVGASARALLGGAIRIEAGHVLGRDAFANAAIESVLNPILGSDAVGASPGTPPLEPRSATGDGTLVIAALPYADTLPGQLLRAVFLIGASVEDLSRTSRALLG